MVDAVSERAKFNWYHGWNIIAVCVLAGVAASALPINAFSLFLHNWSTQLHVPISTLQLGMGACGMGCALLGPLAGMLVDKYPTRNILGLGLGGMGLSCLGISIATRPWQFLAIYAVLLPVSIVCTTSIPANALVTRWFQRRLGLALGLTALGLGMAGVVMPPVVAAVMPLLGWRMIWRIGFIVIVCVILPLVIVVVRERPSNQDGLHYLQPDSANVGGPGQGANGSTGDRLGLRDVLSRKNFWLLVIAYVPMLALHGGCGSNLAPIAVGRGLSSQMAGILLSAYSFSQLAALLGSGILSDRFGNRLPLAGMAFIEAVGGVMIAFGHGIITIVAGALLVGVGGGFWPLLAAAVTVEFGSNGVGRTFGTLVFFLPLAAVAPFGVAKVQESTGGYTTALLVLVALVIIGGVACLFLREKDDGRSESINRRDVVLPLEPRVSSKG